MGMGVMGRFYFCAIFALLALTMPTMAQVPGPHDKYEAQSSKQAAYRPTRRAAGYSKAKKAIHYPKKHKTLVAAPQPVPEPVVAKLPDLLDYFAVLGEKLDDPKDDYLCRVYHRTPQKVDSSGDFSWKDLAAAKRMKLGLCQYVIMGMNPGLRTKLYAAGQQMDADGVRWSMSSAFRDDYRQKIAAGFKASTCGSQHGGSCVTKGWGDGRAVDIIGADKNNGQVWSWLDKHGRKYGLYRPMPGADPPHLQASLESPAKPKARLAHR